MPELVNTTALDITGPETAEHDTRETMIKVDHVSMVFNMASEQLNSLKEYAIKLAKRELFFEGFTALDDVSFEVKKGDVFGIMGTNGSGKSTMMKIIAGVMEPTSGTCTINGNIAPLIELGAGFDLDLSARENIYLNGALLGYSKQFIDEHFDEIVEFAEVEKFLDMPLKNYSSGMVARIAFAIATVIVPDILLVDEVLSVGDFMFQKKCEDRIKQLIEEHGVTVLIVSHNNNQIERLCNKAIWIEKGHTRLIGEASVVAPVYGNLAGRTGSAESEARVMEAVSDLLNSKEPCEYELIAGQTSIGTNAKIVQKCTFDDTDHVIIALNGTHLNAVVGHPLASCLSVPLIISSPNELSEVVEQQLIALGPSSATILDYGDNGSQVEKDIQSLNPRMEIKRITNNSEGPFGFSVEVFRFGNDRGIWRNEPSLVAFEDNSESLAASVITRISKSPVFVTRSDSFDAELFVNCIEELKADKIRIFGETAISKYEAEGKIGRSGIKTVAISGNGHSESCLEICKTAEKEICENEQEASNAILISSSSFSQWQELLSCAQFAESERAPLLLIDKTDLNSIASALDFLEEKSNKFKRLFFVGGDNCLDSTDRAILSTKRQGHSD